MVWLALGAAILLLALWLGRIFADARVDTVKKVALWSGAIFGGGLLLLLLFTGRGGQALWSLLLFAPMLWRLTQGWRAAWRFGRAAPRPEASRPGAETTVETATLTMRLDHVTGRMSGRVRRGRWAGRELAELPLSDLLALLGDCRANDAESVPLLEAWLDRSAPDWREADFAAGTPPPAAGPGRMTRAEALEVLGLKEGASPDEIRAAHRRLMRAAHPDQGGSDWLAARINQARDVLLP